ncbi:hypothetical protein V500_00006 [Pseudogymnoascus sp. VKM F-4518 (FW-2643)]|nr:hypothetical protein V500_00006 [Pseudogymnoascus sp. VKM F-4518 (FW-2643)]
MTPFDDTTTDRIKSDAQQILLAAGTPQCIVWAERPGVWRFRKTFRLSGDSNPDDDGSTDHTTSYCIGSISKILVATAAIILIDQIAECEDTKYMPLRNAWKDSISKHLDIMLRRQHGPDTTISQLLYHFNGPPSMNDFIFGPDGTVLLSKKEFLTTASKIIKDIHAQTSTDDYGWRYNNGGYILAGLLIEKYSGLSLGDFLKQTLFIPLGMSSTYATTQDFEALAEENKAVAHIVSINGRAHSIKRPMYFDETVALAAAGIYSSTKDLALFSKTVLDVLASQDMNGAITFNTATRLLHPRWVFEDGSSGVYTYCGYRTTLDSTKIGSHSPNRALSSPPSEYSCYTLGVGQDILPVEAIYHGGSVTGYECSFYLLPNSDAFVIALSNATGLVDASDHVSRLLLQELLLQPSTNSTEQPLKQARSPERYSSSKPRTKEQPRQSLTLPVRVNIVEMARGGATERQAFLKRYQVPTPHLAMAIHLPRVRAGFYVNRNFRQSLFVEENGNNSMAVYIGGDIEVSGKLRFFQTNSTTAIIVAFEDDTSAVLGSDILGDWKCLDLKIGRDSKGDAVTLARKRAGNFEVIYRYEELFSETAKAGLFPF